MVEKSKRKKRKSKLDRQLYWILLAMAGVFVAFFITYFWFSGLKSFEYNGLKFTKEKFGEIPVYHYYYFLNHDKYGVVQYNLYLRIDPRKNNATVFGDKIEFPEGKTVYLSINTTALTQCSFSQAALGQLSSFLSDNNLNIKSGVPDEVLAKELNATYVTCEKYSNPVILINSGEETSIYSTNSCYRITVANCEILDAVEKFEVQAILDARNNTSTDYISLR